MSEVTSSEAVNNQNIGTIIPTYQLNDFVVRFGDGEDAIWRQVRPLDRVSMEDGEAMVPAVDPSSAESYALYNYDQPTDRWVFVCESENLSTTLANAFISNNNEMATLRGVRIVNLPDFMWWAGI